MTLVLRRAIPLTLAAAAVVVAVAGQAFSTEPSGRFRTDGSVVYDANTGLSWEQSPQTTTRDLSEANAYCVALGGSFRLPSMKELQTVVDRSRHTPAVDTSVFPTVQPGLYWTSTPLAGDTTTMWQVEFGSGVSTFSSSTGSFLTWCVRSPENEAL